MKRVCFEIQFERSGQDPGCDFTTIGNKQAADGTRLWTAGDWHYAELSLLRIVFGVDFSVNQAKSKLCRNEAYAGVTDFGMSESTQQCNSETNASRYHNLATRVIASTICSEMRNLGKLVGHAEVHQMLQQPSSIDHRSIDSVTFDLAPL